MGGGGSLSESNMKTIIGYFLVQKSYRREQVTVGGVGILDTWKGVRSEGVVPSLLVTAVERTLGGEVVWTRQRQ